MDSDLILDEVTRYLEIKSGQQWILEVFVVILVSLLFSFFVKIFLNRLHRTLTKTVNLWDDALVIALKKPLIALIWVVGISFAAKIVYQKTDAILFTAVDPIQDVLIISIIAWFLIRLVEGFQQNFILRGQRTGEQVDRATVDAITKLVRVSIIITTGLVILQTLGFSISGVLAFGGIGGIAIGFAAKDLLSNFFGGLMIYLDRPFAIGDWIRSPDREIEGTVENIGWRLTCIRTFDKRPLYLPNSIFTTISIENPSRMTNRRIYETVGVRYDDASKLDGIIKDVKQMLVEHPEIDSSMTMIVNFNKFAASSLDFFIYTFTHTTNWIKYHEIKHDVLMKTLRIIENAGAEVAFPTSTLHIAENTGPLELTQQSSINAN